MTARRGALLRSSEAVPAKVCGTCGDAFWTQVGLDGHVRLAIHNGLTRRWVTGKISPAGLAALQACGRQIAAQNNARRRRCACCGRVSTPAGLGLHQMSTGHTGWADVTP